MKSMTRRRFVTAVGGLGLAAAAPALRAQAYPTKPIRMILGFAPGGLTDLLARLVAPSMSETLGQQVIVENRAGANGNVGMAAVAAAEPDGHTLLFSSAAQIVFSPNTYKTMPADPIRGLRHITMVAEGDFIIVVNAETGAKTVAQFAELAKSRPGKLNYGTAGAGGNTHVVLELFRRKLGVDVVPVHYRGTGAALPELLANQVQLFAESQPPIEAHLKSGKLNGLTVCGRKRLDAFPAIPTAAEVGIPELANISNWFGLHAPKGTPDAVVERLGVAIRTAANGEAVKERIRAAGMSVVLNTPAEFMARIESSNKVIGEVTRAANIQVE